MSMPHWSISCCCCNNRLRVLKSLLPYVIMSWIRSCWGNRRSCWIGLEFSALWRTGLSICLLVDNSCWMGSTQLSHLSLRWHISPRLRWLLQGCTYLLCLSQSCCRFFRLVDQSNTEIGQLYIPQFLCLAAWRFGDFAIAVCRVSSFHSCSSRKVKVLSVPIRLALPSLVVLLRHELVARQLAAL